MHPIPVRRLTFDIPTAEEFDPVYMARNAAVSYNFTGLGLYVALLEPFIVKSRRRVMDRITDDALREEVDRFCRQEAQHYQQHERFNPAVLAHGYPGLQDRVDRLAGDFRHFLDDRTDRFRNWAPKLALTVDVAPGLVAYVSAAALCFSLMIVLAILNLLGREPPVINRLRAAFNA